VAGVCDRGIKHAENEDAMALLASATPGERAVLVVMDGVSNTEGSSDASLAGARAAREVLAQPFPSGMGTDGSRLAAATAIYTDAVAKANETVVGFTPAGSERPPSATFVCAVVQGSWVCFANVGDSRAYWLPDDGEGVQLSVDDSTAQQLIASGMSRAEAEGGPHGHAITRWLGQDAPDIRPRVGELTVDRPGWLLVCSDGLWNYASEPAAIAEQVRAAGSADPAAIALSLVEFANGCGGQDNITATLARLEPGQNVAPAPESSAQEEPRG
jgi:serine/threonine protein phosphatase PrpC